MSQWSLKRRRKHKTFKDWTCKRCNVLVLAKIPHECDPSTCWACGGRGMSWQGRVDGEWVGYTECALCEGTGKTIWAD